MKKAGSQNLPLPLPLNLTPGSGARGGGRVRERPRHDPILRLHAQRAGGDCTIACLASLTGRSYEDVLVAAATEDPLPHERGLYLKQIERTAAILGYPLRKKKRCNFFTDKGILDVDLKFRSGEIVHHVVILMGGLIFDLPDLTVWTPHEFQRANKATYRSILVPDC